MKKKFNEFLSNFFDKDISVLEAILLALAALCVIVETFAQFF